MSRRGTAAILSSAFGLALLLTLSGTRLASSQVATITVFRTGGAVPAREPWNAFWDKVPLIDIPLSAQQTTPPMGGHRWTMRAGAIHDAGNLYIVTEWADPAADRSVGAQQDFTDAVAVQFPAVAGTTVPALCMGDPSATVNIWQWRAAWQADIHRGYQGGVRTTHPDTVSDLYPFHDEDVFHPGRHAGNPFSLLQRSSPVDNLVAAGFGTLTSDPLPAVSGWGQWRDGAWRVVFSRPLVVGREGNVDLTVPGVTDVAFAVWDGGAGERDGMKSVAAFVRLDLDRTPLGEEPPSSAWTILGLLLALAASFVAVAASKRRRARA